MYMNKNAPQVGQIVKITREDQGDAGYRLLSGARAKVAHCEYVPEYDDYDITIKIIGEHGLAEAADGGWGWLASYGRHGDDYFDGLTCVEHFWHHCELEEN